MHILSAHRARDVLEMFRREVASLQRHDALAAEEMAEAFLEELIQTSKEEQAQDRRIGESAHNFFRSEREGEDEGEGPAQEDSSAKAEADPPPGPEPKPESQHRRFPENVGKHKK